jgi:hypothetical protein
MILSLLGGCSPTAAPFSTPAVTLTGAVSAADPHAATFTADEASRLSCRAARADDALAINLDADVSTVLRGLLAGTTYTCVATNSGVSSSPVSVTTEPLPDTFPVSEVAVAAPVADVGLHLVNLARVGGARTVGQRLAILDAEGRPRWRYEGVGAGDLDAQWVGDGTVRFGGFDGAESVPPSEVTLDGAVVFEAPSTATLPTELPGSWHHDAALAVDGRSVWALTEEQFALEDGGSGRGFVVKRLDSVTGETLWAWSSTEDGVASGLLAIDGATDIDPFHANALWDTIEGGKEKVYVSLRNKNRVVRIDVATGAIDLRIGVGGDLTLLQADGTPADEASWFFGQHDVKRIDDRLVVYDNGTGREVYGGVPWSRALVLVLDESARTARIETSYFGGEEWSEPAWGGLDRRDDGRLDLAIGHIPDGRADARSGLRLLEPAGEDAVVAWELEFRESDVTLYRSYTLPNESSCTYFPIDGYCG